MDRLHEKGLISDPKSKAKSILLSEEGAQIRRTLFGSSAVTKQDRRTVDVAPFEHCKVNEFSVRPVQVSPIRRSSKLGQLRCPRVLAWFSRVADALGATLAVAGSSTGPECDGA